MAKKVKKKIGTGKHSKEAKLSATKEDIRWATNELVADWRADRLKCYRIADAGCGIGLQAISFGKKCGSVIGIDIDHGKIINARKNANALKMRNIEFIEGDALSPDTIEKAKGCSIVFLDPERDASEDSRKIESIRPNLHKFIEKYSVITKDLAIELPPQIKDVPFDCEREYASVDGKLNRLTAYFGGLKKCETSAVVLPQKQTLQKKEGSELLKAGKAGKYIYEADHAVQKAGLLPELSSQTGAALLHEKKYAFFTSDRLLSTALFKARYEVLATMPFDKDRIVSELKKLGAGKVLVRYEVSPEEYWRERNSYESHLEGEKQVTLFEFNEAALICEQLK